MTFVIRALLVLLGLGTGGYGLTQLLRHSWVDLKEVAIWMIVAILLHDAVFAPLCAAVGVLGRRVLPPTWWSPLACGALGVVTLVIVALPVVGRRHAHPDNPTVLDRDYPLGLIIALTVLWALVGITVTTQAVRRRKHRLRCPPRRTGASGHAARPAPPD